MCCCLDSDGVRSVVREELERVTAPASYRNGWCGTCNGYGGGGMILALVNPDDKRRKCVPCPDCSTPKIHPLMEQIIERVMERLSKSTSQDPT